MATWTKHNASRRGENRRCGWYSSCALALGGFKPRGETMQASAIALPRVDSHVGGVRAAGPPG